MVSTSDTLLDSPASGGDSCWHRLHIYWWRCWAWHETLSFSMKCVLDSLFTVGHGSWGAFFPWTVELQCFFERSDSLVASSRGQQRRRSGLHPRVAAVATASCGALREAHTFCLLSARSVWIGFLVQPVGHKDWGFFGSCASGPTKSSMSFVGVSVDF